MPRSSSKPPSPSFHSFPVHLSSDKIKSPPNFAIIGIFLIILFYFIAEARAFLMPATLALLLFFVFTPFTRWMGRRGYGATLSAAIVTLGLLAATASLGYLLSGPVTYVMANSEEIGDRIEDRFRDIRANFRGIEEAAAKLDAIAGTNGGTVATVPVATVPAQSDGTVVTGAPGTAPVSTATSTSQDQTATSTTTVTSSGGQGTAATTTTVVPPPGEIAPVTTQQEVTVSVNTNEAGGALSQILTLGPNIAGQVLFTLVLLFFMISSGDLLYLKIVQSFDTMRDKRAAYMALREIETSLGTYLSAITLVNAGLGVAIGLAMWAWGMPSPVLWAVAGFILNFIPYIGAIMGLIASGLVALLIYDDLWYPIMIALTFLGLTSIEGQFVTPYFVSRRLQLNEVVVFLAVALWAWLWSILGMIVAVPVLVVLRVLAEHVPGWEKFGNFLAGEEPPELEDEDEEEARELVEEGAAADAAAEEAAAEVSAKP